MAIHFILIIGKKELTQNYRNAVSSAGYIPVITDSLEMLKECRQHHGSLSLCTLARMDLLLLPGGGDISPDLLHVPDKGSRGIDRRLDEVQFAYFEYFYSQKKPVIGICKGMQLINAALGGTLIQDMPKHLLNLHAYLTYQDNHHSCTYIPTEKFPDFPNLNPLQSLYQKSRLPFRINSAHHQCIDMPAKELIPFQYSTDNVIEGFIHCELPILGFQWHPERLFCPDGSYLNFFLHCLLSKTFS